ncbi:NAD(P)H-quinone oxidoreductase [Paenibacillus antri]|uniref:NAD(P)H-quinone oxidoreductase n=1 Tax=Paenibacillus antri TaxID=2582848 RepID=A0A5R9GCQ0_9BACL|nr:NAD(P)H-quinone oxidoreductase [Paenibacillus antri]TLS49155.1 NAD(P)H-quinone oxidoreductase [Paenibacillus antri]
MRAIVAEPFGGPETLRLVDRPTPAAGAGELLVRVRATALNRADLLQRMGKYPPPPGVTDILGLEMAGIVEAVGADVDGWRVGDRVCALLPGGGYAEYAVIPAGMAMAIPEPLSFEEAAAIPEAFLTAYLNLWRLGGLRPGHRVLVHAAASGVGTAAIQLVREAGAASYATAGTAAKLEAALSLGAAAAWNYRGGSFREWLLERTDGAGVDIALDFVGAPYFADHLATLAVDGRLIVIGTLGGAAVPGGFSLGTLLARRLHVIGTTLRSRSVADKISLTQDFAAFALPRFADGRLRPIVDSVFPFEEAAEAHRRMESNVNIGKIILRL